MYVHWLLAAGMAGAILEGFMFAALLLSLL